MGERTRSLVLHLDLTCNAEALPQSWQAKKIGANCSCPRRPGIATPQWPLREQNCCCGKSGSLPPNPVQWHMGSAQEERQAAFAGKESPLLEETELTWTREWRTPHSRTLWKTRQILVESN